jgi:DNA modification methylase
MAYKINHANIKNWVRDYDGEPFDAILCDPPYELGFMGKSWDSSGIAFDVDMWADLFKLIKPGGHLLAFSGSRTYHRMAVAIEDAGFEIRDMIEWVYGSGFPKSLNIGKAVDKIQGNEREVTGQSRNGSNSLMGGLSDTTTTTTQDITKGTSPYEGYGTALKPAHEPCVLARKPIEGTVANNVLEYGTGGLNIDGSRVGFSGDSDKKAHADTIKHYKTGNPQDNSWKNSSPITGANEQSNLGRFPANLIHDGSDEVVELFPDANGGKYKAPNARVRNNGMGLGTTDSRAGTSNAPDNYGDSGSAARFFYCAKASKSERNAGLEGFEEKRESDRVKDDGVGGDNPRNRSNNARANHHPTVKPLALTKYLANLIKPPTGGRLLVPFSGSGSEMIGALQAGWEYVEGVELTEEYIPIAEARIKHWLDKMSKEQMELL